MKSKIVKIMQLAIPAMVSSISGIISILFCTRILGQYDNTNYYLLALFLPINYMMFAIFEAIRSASIALSSICKNNVAEIAINVLSLTLISLFSFSILLFVFTIMGEWIAYVLGVVPPKIPVFLNFSCTMIIVGTMNCVFYVCSSTFFAMKKPILGMVVVLVACLLTCLLTYLFSKIMSTSWMGYFIGSLISYLIGIWVSLIFLSQNNVLVIASLLNNFSRIFSKLSPIIKICFPVFMAYLVIFSSLFFVNATLSDFDESVLTGFSMAYRIQNIVILPAITIGSAIAILTCQARVNNDFEEEKMIRLVGYGLCFLLYLAIAIVIYRYRSSLMSMVVTDKKLIDSGATYLKYVSLTYLTMGPNLAFLTYLEQSGEGIKSFLINIFYFVFAVGIGCVSALHYHQYTHLYTAIALINMVFFSYFFPLLFGDIKLTFIKKYTTRKDVSYV